MSQPNCHQCTGCAFKPGADANQEADNLLRGFFSAVSGSPFYCHDSLGWQAGAKHYAKDQVKAIAVLTSANSLKACGVPEEVIAKHRLAIKDVRICGGWKAAVAKLAALGWFKNPDVTMVRRMMSDDAAKLLDRIGKGTRLQRRATMRKIAKYVKWFGNEAKDARIDIGFLVEQGRE